MIKFKLQSVLDYRLIIEEKLQNEFSDARRLLEEQKTVLRGIIEERNKMMENLRNLQRNLVRADDVATIMNYVESLKIRENEQDKIIKMGEELVEKKRQEMMEAVKNRKIMENLKEKHTEEYRKAVNAREQQISDEMNTLKYNR